MEMQGRIQKISSGGGVLTTFFCHQRVSQRAVRTSLEKQFDPEWSNCFLTGSVPEFPRKPIASCDFYEDVGGMSGPPASLLDPPTKCFHNKFQVFSGDELIGIYCGTTTLQGVQAWSQMTVKFRSDSGGSDRGFVAHYFQRPGITNSFALEYEPHTIRPQHRSLKFSNYFTSISSKPKAHNVIL